MTIPRAARSRVPSPRSPVLRALGAVWLGFKFILSLGLVASAAFLLWVSKDLIHRPGPLGIAAFLMLLATLPWVVAERNSRAMGLLSIFMFISFAFLAGSMVMGDIQFPQACKGRSTGFCEVVNGLYALGGPWLAALPMILIAAVFLAGGILILARGGRPMRP